MDYMQIIALFEEIAKNIIKLIDSMQNFFTAYGDKLPSINLGE